MPYRIFKQLQGEVQADVDKRTSLITQVEKSNYLGFVIDAKDEYFVVHRNGASLMSLLQFRLHNSAIEVRDAENKLILSATLTLNDEGRCMLLVDGKELEMWQFRRRALESFFAF